MKYIKLTDMSDPVNITNMNLIGFPEVPHDAFDIFGVLPRPVLTRTYGVRCPVCRVRSSTTDPLNRTVICDICKNFSALTVQRSFRGFLIRKRLQHMRQCDTMNRWFMCNSINGGDLSRNIMEFL
jgi:hypothetical protein